MNHLVGVKVADTTSVLERFIFKDLLLKVARAKTGEKPGLKACCRAFHCNRHSLSETTARALAHAVTCNRGVLSAITIPGGNSGPSQSTCVSL